MMLTYALHPILLRKQQYKNYNVFYILNKCNVKGSLKRSVCRTTKSQKPYRP